MNAHASNPIGVFDSGVGGLTVVRSLMERLPFENIHYFGDTARVPDGLRFCRSDGVPGCLPARQSRLIPTV